MKRRPPLPARLVPALDILGAALVGIAVAWWAVVYGQVIANTGMAAHRTLPCLLRTSDLCSLAMSLCTDRHFLGIERYSAELLWLGAGIICISLFLGQRRRRPPGCS